MPSYPIDPASVPVTPFVNHRQAPPDVIGEFEKIEQGTVNSEALTTSLDAFVNENHSSQVLAPVEEFWYTAPKIEGTRWCELYPYQLLIVRRYEEAYEKVSGREYTFQIPPDGLQYDLPFAISTTVTLGGIVEEHGGAPLRSIRLTGTTGVLVRRPSAPQVEAPNFAQTLLSGTLNAGKDLLNKGKQLYNFVDNAAGNKRYTLNLVPDDQRKGIEQGSGYYQYHLLKRFLEGYSADKRTPGGGELRLALALWKDQEVYLVTPNRLTLTRSAQSPLEYPYQLQLTAWKRINLSGSPNAQRAFVEVGRQDRNVVQRAFDLLTDARTAVQSLRGMIEAVGGDSRKILSHLRDGVLLCKEVLGIHENLDDLGNALKGDYAEAKRLLELIPRLADAEGDVDDPDQYTTTRRAIEMDAEVTGDTAGVPRRGRESAGGTTDTTTEGGLGGLVSAGWVDTQTPGGARVGQPAVDAAGRRQPTAADLAADPDANAGVLSQIKAEDLPPSPRRDQLIAAQRQQVRNLTPVDLASKADDLAAASADLSAILGASDNLYSATYGVRYQDAPKALTDDGLRALQALNDGQQAFALLSMYNAKQADASWVKTMAEVGSLAQTSSIKFTPPKSKFAVAMPYGCTIERLAMMYLGDPDRWLEIATLNDLRSPYVDEVGFYLPLLVPGCDNRLVVAEDDRLAVGQIVWIEAGTHAPTRRRITALDVRDGRLFVTVDGDPDLEPFTPLAGARIHAYLPATVNSRSMIWIPSDQEPDGGWRVAGVSEGANYDPLLSAGGVDLMLTPTGDLVVTPDGDGRWAVGMANLMQQYRLLVGTRQGTLLHHPDFGLPLRVGDSLADIQPQKLLTAVNKALSFDPAFTSVRGIQLDLAGPVLAIKAAIEVSGSGMTVPLSVEVA